MDSMPKTLGILAIMFIFLYALFSPEFETMWNEFTKEEYQGCKFIPNEKTKVYNEPVIISGDLVIVGDDTTDTWKEHVFDNLLPQPVNYVMWDTIEVESLSMQEFKPVERGGEYYYTTTSLNRYAYTVQIKWELSHDYIVYGIAGDTLLSEESIRDMIYEEHFKRGKK